MLFFVVDLPFAVDLEFVVDLTLFSTSFEENSNESRLLLFPDDVGCAFLVWFVLFVFSAVFVFVVEVFDWELLEAVLVFEVGVFVGVCFAVGVERVNVSRFGAEDVCLLCVGALDLDAEPER